MTLVIPAGFASAALIFTGSAGTQPFVTTLGLNIDGFDGDYVDMANTVKSTFVTAAGAAVSNILVLDRVTLTIGTVGPGGSVDSDSAPSPMTGGFASPSAMAISAIVRKSTNRLGRSGRGRMFVPGTIPEAEVDPDGSISAARRTIINNAMSAWNVALQTAGLTPVLLHSTGVLLATPDPITSFTVSDIIGIQRGRIR